MDFVAHQLFSVKNYAFFARFVGLLPISNVKKWTETSKWDSKRMTKYGMCAFSGMIVNSGEVTWVTFTEVW